MNRHGGYHGDLNVVDYSININPIGVTNNIKQIIKESIDNICRYPDIDGKTAKEAISTKYNIDMDNIMMGNGASELIYLFARAIRPKKVLIIEPTFNEYRRAFQLVGSNIEDYILDYKEDFQCNLDKFERKMSSFKPDVVVLCNPNNPTGKFIELDEIKQLMDIISNENSFLFIDESFIEFTRKESIINKLESNNIFSLRSMTKYYAIPGLRIGYGISNKRVIDKMEKYKEPWTMNTFALNIVPKIINDTYFDNKVIDWVKCEREYLYKNLININNLTVYNTYSNFFLCKLNYFSGNMLNLKLLKKNMYVRVCDNFKSLDESFIRIAIKDHSDNEKLIKGLNDLL
ncbi:MAG: aminotransferase class I/II-fold pyridoxal phosphate-dependent enzyme [Vallitalea sp.]|jgi:threonine-phosphate decarboxylase|nr:aminotransferase class I/II-fold pyridoxal phosphate-dependent enzyme [Vallitalea sp.]